MDQQKISQDELLEQTIDRFWEAVPPYWNQVREHIRKVAMEQHDISVEQFHVLRHIRRGVTSVRDLAKVKHISRPAVSQAVDMLVNKGLVNRQPSDQDRRYVNLELTQAGSLLLDAVFLETRAWMREQLATISPDNLASLHKGLEALKSLSVENTQKD